MKVSDSIRWWKICAMGAIDGLAVGVAIEALRLVYEKHRIEVILQEAARHNERVGYVLNLTFDLLIPIICTIAFAGVSLVVYECLIDRPKFIFLLWLIAGVIGVSAGYAMTPGSRNPFALLYLALFSGISYLVFRLWKRRSNFAPFLWQVIGISTVLILAASSQIIGLFVIQRFELRQPLTWLLCFVLVLLVNFIYGALLRRGFSQQLENTMHVYD